VPSLRAIVPNRPGLLAEITECLAARNIDIQNVVVETHGEGALVRIDVADENEAMECLAAAGYQAVTDDVVIARIEDKAGALAHVSRRLAEAKINIRALHHVRRDSGFAVVAISTDDNARTRDVLGELAL
jgi:hypothetical protein